MGDFQLWQNYSRKWIADVLGIKSEQALWRGVFTPRGRKMIFLFVTREKQRSQTQYKDSILGDTLVWEGEAKHGNDKRIVDAAKNGDKIILFFRTKHHRPFVYFDQIYLQDYKYGIDRPSCFVFKIKALELKTDNDYTSPTERIVPRRERVGQDKFREDVLGLWSKSCAVTSLQGSKLLRASHIRPWRHCSAKDRLNRYNGLALIPNLDLLFDIGFVTFDEMSGSIRLAEGLDSREWQILNVRPEMSLRMVFPESKEYLKYHEDCVFEVWKKKMKHMADILG